MVFTEVLIAQEARKDTPYASPSNSFIRKMLIWDVEKEFETVMAEANVNYKDANRHEWHRVLANSTTNTSIGVICGVLGAILLVGGIYCSCRRKNRLNAERARTHHNDKDVTNDDVVGVDIHDYDEARQEDQHATNGDNQD